MAQNVFFTAITVVFLVVLSAVITDFFLWLDGDQTISAWLRLHPWWFWGPAGVTLVFLVGLGLHLFVLKGWLY